MNKQPIFYMQSDKRWAKVPYNGPNETGRNIESSGCGPTCAAMCIATLADKAITPVDTCAWSCEHGYKYKNQGTAYSYFKPQLAEYGIECRQLLSGSLKNKPDDPIHEQVKKYLEEGYWIIALMGIKADGSRGFWTSGGHYILVWAWDDKVRINDPIHSGSAYANGDPSTFKDEVRNYWLVDARSYNGQPIKPPKDVNYIGLVNTSSKPLNCRTIPGGNTIVKQYAKGAYVNISKEQDGWAYTGEGWVDLQYIKEVDAIDKLFNLRVINSPDYWREIVKAGKVKYLDILFNKAAAKITQAGQRTATAQQGVDILIAAEVINSPEYWLEQTSVDADPNLGALLCALGGAVSYGCS